ncbi:MAG: hypothetical protein ACFCUE_09800 [Candidatus Bathyarchaeia archaeon]|jgi:hypothetical protein
MSKSADAVLLTLILILLSVIIVKPIFAQNTNPAIPEFTVTFVDSSYEVPASSYTDKYTGETIITPSYYVISNHLELVIENQPFNSTWGNRSYYLNYNVRAKGHFEQGWTVLYQKSSGEYFNYPFQLDSKFTNISIPNIYPNGAKIDFQVAAFISHKETVLNPLHPQLGPEYGVEEITVYKIDDTSGWSDTQTLTIPNSSSSITSQPTNELINSGWKGSTEIIITVVGIIAILIVALAISRKHAILKKA